MEIGVCGVCVVDGWFTASPGVRLIGLWLGGAAHLGCMSNHGTQDKPAINTHTRRGVTLPHWRPMWGSSDQEGLPKTALEPPAAVEDSHLNTSSS